MITIYVYGGKKTQCFLILDKKVVYTFFCLFLRKTLVVQISGEDTEEQGSKYYVPVGLKKVFCYM